MSRFLDGINGPQDLKKLKKEDLPVLAEEIRDTLLATISKTGGHLGSNGFCRQLNVDFVDC